MACCYNPCSSLLLLTSVSSCAAAKPLLPTPSSLSLARSPLSLSSFPRNSLKKLRCVPQSTSQRLERLEELQELQKKKSQEKDFLASFLEFLRQPCGDLDLQTKYALLSGHILPQISAHRGFVQHNSEYKPNYDVARTCLTAISHDAMQSANSSLEYFFRSYLMFHGMDVSKPKDVFNYLPLFSFIEAYIYQLDNLNEKVLQIPASDGLLNSNQESKEVNLMSAANLFKSGPFGPLSELLDSLGLLTERIKDEFKGGEEYWKLERLLCGAIANGEDILVEEVLKAVHLKTTDYRILNLLLYQLRGEQVDEMHMEFFSVSAFLDEVADDLFDYERDVAENSFNVLRMFVGMYGTSAPTMLAKYITEAEEKYNILFNSLDSHLSSAYQRRCEEVTREGGNIWKHNLGTWNIPPLILDEKQYRCTATGN